MPADVICVSRSLGARGEQVAGRAAKRLGFRYVDDEILIAAAERQQLDRDQLAAVERRRSGLTRFVDEFVGGGTITEALRSFIRQELVDTASDGRVVIVAHGASIALAGAPRLLRVLVTGSPNVRAARIAETEQLTTEQAEKRIRDSDKSRADYLKRFYSIDENAADYDLVVNTDRLSVEHAAELILQAADSVNEATTNT